ncbi:lysosome-associated membrane glycoprotein 2 isoform X2 [Hypomesus transpacificus]|uniref:lysosome-associated membrane glycoprotein 2 isoform X2 n=1 Tax=Hypomesus transpacificus TaxID=137520 RepID=UPI001F084878|nr:lysosome-associated membrane glycoprotein 2 isoform X2 [Hypomesus transpacificus]
MFRFACVILFLSLGHDTMCDMSGAVGNTTIVPPSTQAPPTTNATTILPTTTKATTIPTTNTTTILPTTTKATTIPPTTNATTVPPTTNATTVPPTTNATTVPPTTNATTLAPTTNATTLPPTTNATTPAPVPTTTPTPTLPTPSTGKYSIKTGNNTTCLLADFGLRIGFIQGGKGQEINLMPNATTSTGTCGVNTSELILTSDIITIIFSFNHEVKNFRLHALNVTIKSDSGVDFKQANTNLTLWQAAVGSSYMCNKQQSYNITDVLTLNTYELRVQPFEVTKDKFSTAHECSLDDTSILIPIIVGAALAGMILIVVIAYAIGRRKTYVGYQTL